MQIIESENVDLISPFPLNEIKRLVGWLHCYRTMLEFDGGPKTEEEHEFYWRNIIQTYPTWGVIDKNNKLNYKHAAPLIGFFWAEPTNFSNVYMHLTSTRKAWASGLMDEGAHALIKELFEKNPGLLRLSGAILNSNKPAKNFAKRVGMKQDGLFKDFVTQNGQPKAVAHFGLTRSDLWAGYSAAAKQPNPVTTDNSSEQTLT